MPPLLRLLELLDPPLPPELMHLLLGFAKTKLNCVQPNLSFFSTNICIPQNDIVATDASDERENVFNAVGKSAMTSSSSSFKGSKDFDSFNAATFSMVTLQGGFSGIDFMTVLSQGNWYKTSYLLSEHKSNSFHGRNDIKQLLNRMKETGLINERLAASIEEEAMRLQRILWMGTFRVPPLFLILT